MFNKSSGSMYEELENTRLKKIHKTKIIFRRVIAITILILILTYLGILLYDVKRYHDGATTPLILTKTTTKEYDDGTVTTYYSIGWIFRFYERETIKSSEIAPFWSKIKMDNVLIRDNEANLPDVETDYTIPTNYNNYEKVSNVLFFYDNDKNLLGTYACILSSTDCEISINDALKEDDLSDETKMGIIDNRYVFITEYKSKGTDAEEKHVYLYDIKANRIIAEYQNVRYSKLDTDDKKGYIDSSKYIIERNGKWGIDQVIKGKVTNLLDYNYDYVSFDTDNNLYILKDSTGWFTYNANTKAFTSPISSQIRTLYVRNDRVYYITYDITYYEKKNYKLYTQDGTAALNKDNINNLKAYDRFLTYMVDQKLYIIDYEGNQVIEPIALLFTSYSIYGVQPYYISTENDTLIIKTPLDYSTTHLTNEYYYDLNTWALLKTRTNVKETLDN